MLLLRAPQNRKPKKNGRAKTEQKSQLCSCAPIMSSSNCDAGRACALILVGGLCIAAGSPFYSTAFSNSDGWPESASLYAAPSPPKSCPWATTAVHVRALGVPVLSRGSGGVRSRQQLHGLALRKLRRPGPGTRPPQAAMSSVVTDRELL